MFEISKGINLSHWLSQVFGWSPRDKFITQSDIHFLAQSGFDHVRIPIDEDQMWFANGEKNTPAFADLHRCIDWCLQENLRVAVDLHILRSHHFNAGNNEGAMTLWDTPEHQDGMINLWQQLSAELFHYPLDMLAYEFMNEPVAPKHSMWNDLVARGHAAIRELEPARTIVFGPNMWQFPQFFPKFRVPENDSNIILSFHTYDPLPLTHYKAYWMPLGAYSGPVHYPGNTISDEDFHEFERATKGDRVLDIVAHNRYYSKETFVSIIAPALAFAKQTGLRLYCNEFGCLPSVTREDRLRYFSDIIDVFQSHGIAYASWDYKGDFGIVSWDRNEYVNGVEDFEVIQILTR